MRWLRSLLGIDSLEHRIETLERLLYHRKSHLNGFAVLKRHLNRSDVPLPLFAGEEIEQD